LPPGGAHFLANFSAKLVNRYCAQIALIFKLQLALKPAQSGQPNSHIKSERQFGSPLNERNSFNPLAKKSH
jgi:hypothetical protein